MVGARFRPEHDVKRLLWSIVEVRHDDSAWCTPRMLMPLCCDSSLWKEAENPSPNRRTKNKVLGDRIQTVLKKKSLPGSVQTIIEFHVPIMAI